MKPFLPAPKLHLHTVAVTALVTGSLLGSNTARAEVPAEYTGTPYMGVPQTIPGRVELADLDEGGLNVAFYADHRRENAVAEGYSPISGDDYRMGNLDLPNICKTNRAVEMPGQGSEDFWEDGSRYPSEDNLYEYYMGYAHTVDWVRVTVNVQQAGTYNVSSNWACANNPCGLSIWFNDGSGVVDNPDRPLDGENKTGTVQLDATNDYHKWRAYPNFTQVELSAGEQLMTFNIEVADHLQYGFLQFDLVGGENQGGAGGAAGEGGASAGGSGGSATAGTGGTGTAGSSAGGALGGTAGSGGGAQATAGASGSAGSLGSTASTAGGSNDPVAGGDGSGSDVNTDSGCAFTPGANASRGALAFGLLLAGVLFARTRRARG